MSIQSASVFCLLHITEQSAHRRPDVGEGPLAGRSHRLARWQTHHSAGRRAAGQSVVQQHPVVRRQCDIGHAGVGPDRAVQCAARPVQVGCVSAAEEDGRVRGQSASADVRCASDRAERRAGQVHGTEQGGAVQAELLQVSGMSWAIGMRQRQV